MVRKDLKGIDINGAVAYNNSARVEIPHKIVFAPRYAAYKWSGLQIVFAS